MRSRRLHFILITTVLYLWIIRPRCRSGAKLFGRRATWTPLRISNKILR